MFFAYWEKGRPVIICDTAGLHYHHQCDWGWHQLACQSLKADYPIEMYWVFPQSVLQCEDLEIITRYMFFSWISFIQSVDRSSTLVQTDIFLTTIKWIGIPIATSHLLYVYKYLNLYLKNWWQISHSWVPDRNIPLNLVISWYSWYFFFFLSWEIWSRQFLVRRGNFDPLCF